MGHLLHYRIETAQKRTPDPFRFHTAKLHLKARDLSLKFAYAHVVSIQRVESVTCPPAEGLFEQAANPGNDI